MAEVKASVPDVVLEHLVTVATQARTLIEQAGGAIVTTTVTMTVEAAGAVARELLEARQRLVLFDAWFEDDPDALDLYVEWLDERAEAGDEDGDGNA